MEIDVLFLREIFTHPSCLEIRSLGDSKHCTVLYSVFHLISGSRRFQTNLIKSNLNLRRFHQDIVFDFSQDESVVLYFAQVENPNNLTLMLLV